MLYIDKGWDTPLAQVPEGVTRVWGLVLNPMRGRTEAQQLIAVSDIKDEILAFWRAEKVEPYKDGEWQRAYRAGGPLEWYNPPWSEDVRDHHGNGIVELRRDGWRVVG